MQPTTLNHTRLLDLRAGERGLVISLGSGKQLISRLTALGFTPGESWRSIKTMPTARNCDRARRAGGHWAWGGRGHFSGAEGRMSCHSDTATSPALHVENAQRTTLIALAGQPNMGKSTCSTCSLA
jgi:hypothetical protein